MLALTGAGAFFLTSCDKDGYELSGAQIEAGAAFWVYAPAEGGTITFSL